MPHGLSSVDTGVESSFVMSCLVLTPLVIQVGADTPCCVHERSDADTSYTPE